jgi:hypothetical protein
VSVSSIGEGLEPAGILDAFPELFRQLTPIAHSHQQDT